MTSATPIFRKCALSRMFRQGRGFHVSDNFHTRSTMEYHVIIFSDLSVLKSAESADDGCWIRCSRNGGWPAAARRTPATSDASNEGVDRNDTTTPDSRHFLTSNHCSYILLYKLYQIIIQNDANIAANIAATLYYLVQR